MDHLGKEIPFAKLLARLGHFMDRDEAVPLLPPDEWLNDLVSCDLLGAGGCQDAGHNILIEGMGILELNLWVRADQVKQKSGLWFLISNDQQHTNALGLDLDH